MIEKDQGWYTLEIETGTEPDKKKGFTQAQNK